MRSIAIVILAALVAAFGAACMGDDEGEQSRRPAALGETPPEDPEEPTTPPPGPQPNPTSSAQPTMLSLSLTVVDSFSDTSKDRQGSLEDLFVDLNDVKNGIRLPGGGGPFCGVTLVQRETTCTWTIQQTASCLNPNCVTVVLRAWPARGARVVWTGCYLVLPLPLGEGKEDCHARVVLGGKSVRTVFVAK